MAATGERTFSGSTETTLLADVLGGVLFHVVDYVGPDQPGVFTTVIERISNVLDCKYTMNDLQLARERTAGSKLDDRIVEVDRGDRLLILQLFSELVITKAEGITPSAVTIIEKMGKRLGLAPATIEREVMAVVALVNWN